MICSALLEALRVRPSASDWLVVRMSGGFGGGGAAIAANKSAIAERRSARRRPATTADALLGDRALALLSPQRPRFSSTMTARPPALVLYRHILRTLQQWPSVKRDKVANEIRLEFKNNMHEADAAKRQKMLAEAEAGLRSLRQQCGLADGTEVAFNSDAELQHQARTRG